MPRKGNDMSMIKRVAIALLAIEDSWNDHEREQLPEGAQALLMARAAIEAMREPTEEMCSAAAKGLRNLIQSIPLEEREPRWGKPRQKLGYCIPHNEKHRARWQAMIDAAL